MTELSGQENRNRELRDLTDPEFFAHWAIVRNRLALTPKSSPEHSSVKRRYDAVIAEYRRRIDGGLTRTP